MFSGPTRSALLWSIGIESFAHRRLDEARVGLPPGRFHDLPDEEPDGLRLAGPIVGDGLWVGGDDVVDGRRDGPYVRDLAIAACGDDRRCRVARRRVRL